MTNKSNGGQHKKTQDCVDSYTTLSVIGIIYIKKADVEDVEVKSTGEYTTGDLDKAT